MKPSKETGDRRVAERRTTEPAERRADVRQAVEGDRRVVEKRGVAKAMVDALEDILKWERASERSLRIAKATGLPN
jgi:hypothetical protein